jgi:hypothetical protein
LATGTPLRQALNVIWHERYDVGFDEWVTQRRSEKASWRTIEREIAERADISVSHVALIKWFRPDEVGAA